MIESYGSENQRTFARKRENQSRFVNQTRIKVNLVKYFGSLEFPLCDARPRP